MRLDPYSYFGEVARIEEAGSMVLTETIYEPGMNLPSHSHGSDHLAILLEGSYLEQSSQGVYLCLPGDAVHYGTDIHHSNLFGNRVGRCLNFEFQPGEAPSTCQVNCSYVPTEIRSLLASAGRDVKPGISGWLETARRKIDHFPSFTMSTLAQEVGVHPSYLAKSFRRAFGLSVGQYATLARVRYGARNLIETDTSIAEIAFDAGFFDQSHFSNTFQRITGFTPAHLRRVATSW
jgi:AraC family transcriptional regulator